jgi:hypothetical protein
MSRPLAILLLGVMLVAGCKSTKTVPSPPPTKGGVTAVKSGVGKVALVDTDLGFVVLDYTLQKLPRPDLRLTVYRGSQKIGQVTATRQSEDSYLIADINSGIIQVGDEARED